MRTYVYVRAYAYSRKIYASHASRYAFMRVYALQYVLIRNTYLYSRVIPRHSVVNR